MMSPHMSKTSGALPATMAATSLFCQSSGVGWSVTLPILVLLSVSVGSTLAVPAIQKSEADICQSRSVWPLPCTFSDGRGVGAGVAPPAAGLVASAGLVAAAAAAAGVFVAAAAAAAGLVASAGLVAAPAAAAGVLVGAAAAGAAGLVGSAALAGSAGLAGAGVAVAAAPQAASRSVPSAPVPVSTNRRRDRAFRIGTP